MQQFKMFYRRAALFALGAGCLTSVSLAGPVPVICPTAAPATIASLGGACLFGGTLFSNISLQGSTTSPGTPAGSIDPTQVSIQFTAAGTDLEVVTLTNLTPANWALTGSQQFDLILNYTMSGGPWLQSFGDSMVASGTSGGSGTGAVSFDKAAQNGSSPVQTLPTLSLALLSNPQTDFTGAPAPPLSTVDITDNIQVHATNASATLTSAANSFVVPEPMTSILLGSGLLATGLLRRRRRG